MAKKSHTGSAALPYRLATRLAPVFLLCLLWISFPNAIQAASRNIEVHHADANEIAQTLEGLIEPGGSLSVYQNTLVIQASPANIDELQGIIELLDEAPRSLLISIRSPTQSVANNGVFKTTLRSKSYRSDGYGNNHTLRNPDGTITQTTVRLSSANRGSTTLGGSDRAQTIRALEGRDALIRMSSLSSSAHSGEHQGFYANARVQGKRVTINVHTDDGSVKGGEYRSASINTQVTGQLGQWIQVGTLAAADNKQGASTGAYAWNSQSTSRVVYLKIDLLEGR